MASSKFTVLAAILLLLLLPMVANGDRSLSPSLSPYIKDICEEVTCGKGTCKEAVGSAFNFVCECDAGWKRTQLSDEDNFKFLPCIIPNCSVDYSCMPAAPPAPAVPPYNLSFFDPCYWIYCGEGSCSKNSTYRHTCKCNAGYSNLLDVAAFPCYSECAVGSDCQKLGISVSKSTSSTPSNDSNLATSSSVPRMLLGMAISLVSSVAVLQWK